MAPTKLTSEEVTTQLKELEGWSLGENEKTIEKHFELADFAQALSLTNKIGDLAETADHHPEITLTWGKVTVSLSTHEADGLTEKDFALAKQIDQAR